MSLMKDPIHEFMGNLFSNGHAEWAPVLCPNEECWYLSRFGVYHPKKPNKVRVVFNQMKFYTDSKVVLRYICNRSKRFYQYVSNRVQKLIHASNSGQWNYVPSVSNPADIGSRGASVEQLEESRWLTGPHFLLRESLPDHEHFPIVNPDHDQNICKEVSVRSTNVSVEKPDSSLFDRFSFFRSVIRAGSTLRHIPVSYHKNLPCNGWHVCSDSKDEGRRDKARI